MRLRLLENTNVVECLMKMSEFPSWPFWCSQLPDIYIRRTFRKACHVFRTSIENLFLKQSVSWPHQSKPGALCKPLSGMGISKNREWKRKKSKKGQRSSLKGKDAKAIKMPKKWRRWKRYISRDSYNCLVVGSLYIVALRSYLFAFQFMELWIYIGMSLQLRSMEKRRLNYRVSPSSMAVSYHSLFAYTVDYH